MFSEYKATTDLLISQFGAKRLVDDLAADDFESLRERMSERWGLTRLANEIQKCRTVFKHGLDNGLIEKPVRFGSEFRRPGKKAMRKHRAESGKKLLTAEEIRKLLDVADDPHLKCMLLLGINCAYGNMDCACLKISAIDLDRVWIDYPRPKTGVERSAKMWPETVAALQQFLKERPEPRREADRELVFIKPNGRSWITGGVANAISIATATLMKQVGCHRKGISFYVLRHTFRTVADSTKDFPAIRMVMGHSDSSIDDVYRERIDDSRLVP